VEGVFCREKDVLCVEGQCNAYTLPVCRVVVVRRCDIQEGANRKSATHPDQFTTYSAVQAPQPHER